MIQPNEALALASLVVAALVLAGVARREGVVTRPRKLFVTGFLCMFCAHVFTILEGYLLPDVLNALEHVMYACSGVAFAVSVWLSGVERATPRRSAR